MEELELNNETAVSNTDISEQIASINPSDGEYKWYIIGTYSGHEKKVAQHLEQRIKANAVEEEITDVLVPTQEKVVAKDGKKRTLEERIFPGYVLIRMIINDDTWHLVRNTDGVTGFIGATKKPTPISDEEVSRIMAFTQVKQKSYQTGFRVGSSVKVTDGAFKDFVGKVEEINPGKEQVTVLLSIFGRETPVQLTFAQIDNL